MAVGISFSPVSYLEYRLPGGRRPLLAGILQLSDLHPRVRTVAVSRCAVPARFCPRVVAEKMSAGFTAALCVRQGYRFPRFHTWNILSVTYRGFLQAPFETGVWDSGEGKDGKTATAGFVSGLMKSIPPMNEMFQMAAISVLTMMSASWVAFSRAARAASAFCSAA